MSGEGTSSQPTTPVPPELYHQAKEMFGKTSVYLQGQLEGTADEYKLIEDMNKATAQRYADMSQVSKNVGRSLGDLNAKLENLRPYLDQIDQIDQQTKKLEEAAYAIDAYAKNLEAKFKTLEKRGSS